MPNAWILNGVRIVDPSNGVDECGRLAVLGGRFVPPDSVPGAPVLDLAGLVAAPGFIDLHVHLREPGQTEKEDIATGTRAAAAGGFTTVVAMPNTVPPVDSPEMLAEIADIIRRKAVVRVLQTACLTVGRRGSRAVDAVAARDAGAVAFTDDGNTVLDPGVMFEAMRRSATAGLPVLDHCEDPALMDSGVLHEGAAARKLGLPGKPAISEVLPVVRDIALARAAGCPVHIQHVSCADTVQWVRMARKMGVPISAEATPHHLLLTDAACLDYGANAKMNPPLRTEADRGAIVDGVREGVIEVIATDHAPHTAAEKARPFAEAPSGIVGLETAAPLCLTHLYHAGVLELGQLIACFTRGPRRILGLPFGTLGLGAPADLTLLDLDADHVIDAAQFRSKSRNSPFVGWKCRGKAVATMVGGRWVWSEIQGVPVEID